jgi:hypothetical protein
MNRQPRKLTVKGRFMALSESREASSFPRKDYYTNFPINHMRPTGPTREAWGVRLSGFAPVEAV